MRVKIRNNRVTIDGYVNAVGRDSKLLKDEEGEFVEQILPGAFANALKRATKPIKLLRDHEEKWNLGDTTRNLELYEDEIGLHAHAEIEDAETTEKARSGKLRGWSFGFYELDRETEKTAAGKTRRIVKELDLVEVSIIDDLKYPAYAGTSITSRAIEGSNDLIIRCIDTTFEVEEDTKQQDPKLGYYKSIIKTLK